MLITPAKIDVPLKFYALAMTDSVPIETLERQCRCKCAFPYPARLTAYESGADTAGNSESEARRMALLRPPRPRPAGLPGSRLHGAAHADAAMVLPDPGAGRAARAGAPH